MHKLDLRGVACPMNFVKTKLRLDKLEPGELLEVTLDLGEPYESVSESVQADGHTIEGSEAGPDGFATVVIRKNGAPSI
ncbi:MAG: sulfurtransferase TusA family protein [Cyanobacteria bacterium SZAS LIN-2]|nr:sulfurtransferase TusA family protein [Cyanobacteria bacterium SZAS LIN-3]MBS1996365.1 sulfurtransferase TusA family protein [Cyanobacteria bacterium SZAS LIN-2]MBS2007501.1 sulfurtransferase TusA family protein [Cyanobacteria bacterium SZAS TMP-1]